jgi:hypothetical protein
VYGLLSTGFRDKNGNEDGIAKVTHQEISAMENQEAGKQRSGTMAIKMFIVWRVVLLLTLTPQYSNSDPILIYRAVS